MYKVLALAAAVSFGATPALASAPGGVHVMLPNGNSYVESSSTSGTLSSGGVTYTWTVGSSSATIEIQGSYTTSWIHPKIDIYWFSTGGDMPMRIQVTDSGSGRYDLRLPVLEPGQSWDSSRSQSDLSGNLDYQHIFPEASRMDVEIPLKDQSTPYDMTIQMDWGAGVSSEDHSWGTLKAASR